MPDIFNAYYHHLQRTLLVLCMACVLMTACATAPEIQVDVATPVLETATTVPPTWTPTATVTPLPTNTPFYTATATLIAVAAAPTETPVVVCNRRFPENDLLILVNRDFHLSADYEPTDLVLLANYFNPRVTLNYQTRVREDLMPPLIEMIETMYNAGLQPSIISGYRSYQQQQIAWDKWKNWYGERAENLSARPGTSEHQLGSTVDFGSPTLQHTFHTSFENTGEGVWLLENAHLYGFTLSYPRDAQEITGYEYEPWHYRYVGVALATELYESELTLTEYQLAQLPSLCLNQLEQQEIP